jgi:hypothetical protein
MVGEISKVPFGLPVISHSSTILPGQWASQVLDQNSLLGLATHLSTALSRSIPIPQSTIHLDVLLRLLPLALGYGIPRSLL